MGMLQGRFFAIAKFSALALTALAVALPTLFYQNTGWVQFGPRFSLDYLPLLFVLVALSGRRRGQQHPRSKRDRSPPAACGSSASAARRWPPSSASPWAPCSSRAAASSHGRT